MKKTSEGLKQTNDKLSFDLERQDVELQRVSAELHAWIPAIRILLSDTQWAANEAEVRPLLLMLHPSWDEDAKTFKIADAKDMSTMFIPAPEPYLASEFELKYETDPKFLTLVKWFRSPFAYGELHDLVTIQLEWVESHPAVEDGWFLLLLKVYLERQLQRASSVQDSVRVTMVMALLWQLNNVFEGRGLSKIFHNGTAPETTKAIESAALIGLLPFVMFARMRSTHALSPENDTGDTPPGFERDIEGRTLQDYLAIIPAGGSFVDSITDKRLLPLWRTLRTYVFDEDDGGTRLIFIWKLDIQSPAHKARVIFTVKGAVTTFNPTLVIKAHPLTGNMSLHTSADSPGFQLRTLDRVWYWAHMFFGDQCIAVKNEYGRNVVRLRREARNQYGTIEEAIKAESAAGIGEASGALIKIKP